jgi:PilZ domain
MAYTREKRKYRRFDLRLPVLVTLRPRGIPSEIEARSRNVSLGGILLEAKARIAQNTQVAFVITINVAAATHAIELIGEGNVIRVEPISKSVVRVAVACKGPLVYRRYFPQTSVF